MHEVDDCRFDVSLNDCAWYLRADSSSTKNHWIDVIDSLKAESGYGSENNLKRNGSSLSILSSNMSTMSPVFKKNKGLQDKLNELVAFRGILINQIDRLQMYFDTCLSEFASSNGKYSIYNFSIQNVNTYILPIQNNFRLRIKTIFLIISVVMLLNKIDN